ncbi:RNA-directed DNA polymerase, eukaryota, nucleotide-binding alpha-beta plait domain protein [Tanacetum coccineum]
MGLRSQNSLQSKYDQTSNISKSVFISNFPNDYTSKDLWKACNDYGTVVDVFIPNKRSKTRMRFAFVRFIKVTNLIRLVENLNTIWLGRLHLSANFARFDRPIAPLAQKAKQVPNAVPRQPNVQSHSEPVVKGLTPPYCLKPTLVLDDDCLVNRDLDNCVMGEVLKFSSFIMKDFIILVLFI